MEIRASVQYSRARHQLSPRQKRTLNIFETIYGKTLFDRRDPDYRQAGAQAYRRFDKILGECVCGQPTLPSRTKEEANKKTRCTKIF
jgi:hypothetical protein